MIMSKDTSSSYTASRSSQGSNRFRESTHLIPSVDSGGTQNKRFNPLIMNLAVVLGIPMLMFLEGVALEVALMVSQKRNGFPVPPENVIQLVSSQFLLSFVPTALIAPNAILWREIDWMLRSYQPYITLWKGKATAEESLLLDYISLGPLFTIFRAKQYKHRIIFWSAITAVVSFSIQPLTGSIFQIRQKPKTTSSSVISRGSIGLSPDLDDLSPFAAAAGYVDAAVFQSLPDPPFVRAGWASAGFTFPTNPLLNGTMTVNTTGIQTKVACTTPFSTNSISEGGSFTFSSTSVNQCSHSVTFNPLTQYYGVDAVTCPGSPDSLDPKFKPVMFWFFHNKTDGSPDAKAVFCSPSIQAFNVKVSTKLADASLYDVVILSDHVSENNVTGGSLAGKAFNGLIFPDPQIGFIEARATAAKFGVSGAIFRAASQSEIGLQGTFDLPTNFLDHTTTVYTQYLSVAAKSIYFVRENNTLPADMTSLIPVLWIDAFPAHILSIILISIGIVGAVLQILHRRDRKKLLLAAEPGSIASIVSLTSRSGFGDLLLPYDDEKSLERKLHGLRFRMDKRTGAIVADDNGTEQEAMGPDDAMLSLLGSHQRDTAASSSTTLAYQAAAGYPPWGQPLKTPYDR